MSELFSDPTFWFALLAAVISILSATREFWDSTRQQRSEVRRDEIAYLHRQVEDLKRANELCEVRCDELREEMLHLMAQFAINTKRLRKRAAT